MGLSFYLFFDAVFRFFKLLLYRTSLIDINRIHKRTLLPKTSPIQAAKGFDRCLTPKLWGCRLYLDFCKERRTIQRTRLEGER